MLWHFKFYYKLEKRIYVKENQEYWDWDFNYYFVISSFTNFVYLVVQKKV